MMIKKYFKSNILIIITILLVIYLNSYFIAIIASNLFIDNISYKNFNIEKPNDTSIIYSYGKNYNSKDFPLYVGDIIDAKYLSNWNIYDLFLSNKDSNIINKEFHTNFKSSYNFNDLKYIEKGYILFYNEIFIAIDFISSHEYLDKFDLFYNVMKSDGINYDNKNKYHCVSNNLCSSRGEKDGIQYIVDFNYDKYMAVLYRMNNFIVKVLYYTNKNEKSYEMDLLKVSKNISKMIKSENKRLNKIYPNDKYDNLDKVKKAILEYKNKSSL